MNLTAIRDQDDPAVRVAQERELLEAWDVPRGWRRWSEVNNDTVGVWYLCTAFAFFLFAGVLALLMRVQLALPENDFIDAKTYAQAFTLHGSAMMFLFAVPVFEAFAILLLPQILGTRDLPFPRLTAFGFWCFLIGGVFVCSSILFGVAPEGGWFMYPPMTTRFSPGPGADIWLLGLSFIEISSIAAAIELIVGILRCRPPGMALHLMPLYAWYVLVVAVMILLAFPPLIAGDLLFELERGFDWPFFDAARGGDPLLWQHLFWIFGHPEVYIIFLPAMALVAMMVPTFAGVPIASYSWVVLSAVATGFLSFGLWVHHMYTTGLPAISLGFFSAASVAVAIPTAVQIFCFIATFMVGRLRPSVPMLFLAGALAIFVIGGLSGVMVAIAPFDFQAHDTYFVVAHLHYVLVGGMLFPVLAATHYYYPLIRARTLSARLGRWSFWMMFGGFNLAFLPMHLTGLAGMPRRVWTYSEASGLGTLNVISTIGAFVFAAGMLLFVFDVLRPRRSAAPVPRNPWNAGSLEWLSPLPKPSYAPRCIPHITSRDPLWQQAELVAEVDTGRHYLSDSPLHWRETLITDPLSAEPQQSLRVPGPGWVPMIAALFSGGVFVFATFYWWTPAAVCAVGALAAFLHWLWSAPNARGHALRHIGHGLLVPTHVCGLRAVSGWAMLILLIADGAAFLSLLFALFYYWTVNAELPVVDVASAALNWWTIALIALLLSSAALWAARRFNRREQRRRSGPALTLALLGALLAAVCIPLGPLTAGIDPRVHAWTATLWTLAGWCAAHAAIAALMLAYCLARVLARRIDAIHDNELRNTAMWMHYTLGIALIALPLLTFFPGRA